MLFHCAWPSAQRNANRNAIARSAVKVGEVDHFHPTPPLPLSSHWKSDLDMGRSFQSVRLGVNCIADRWERASKKYKCGKRVVQIAKKYSSEGFVGCNDPLESVLFSAMMEVGKLYQNNTETPTNTDLK